MPDAAVPPREARGPRAAALRRDGRSRPTHPDLDELTIHWRAALNIASDALTAVQESGSGVQADGLGVGALRTRLDLERDRTERLLQSLARVEHVELRQRVTAPRPTPKLLGLPDTVRVLLFDLDGVLTPTAEIHAAAWATAVDEFLDRMTEGKREHYGPYRPFDRRLDYGRYVHGQPRLVAVRALLASRGINLPEGLPDDPPGAPTVRGIANRKNEALLELLDTGVHAYAGARHYLQEAHEAGLRSVVVSASANTATILDRSGLARLIDFRIDGVEMSRERLRPKPAPDTLLAACDRLAMAPAEAAIFETTPAGIHAGQAAGVGFTVGVGRTDAARVLAGEGCDAVVDDLARLLDPSLGPQEPPRRRRR